LHGARAEIEGKKVMPSVATHVEISTHSPNQYIHGSVNKHITPIEEHGSLRLSGMSKGVGVIKSLADKPFFSKPLFPLCQQKRGLTPEALPCAPYGISRVSTFFVDNLETNLLNRRG
jgi:hypothetical protein